MGGSAASHRAATTAPLRAAYVQRKFSTSDCWPDPKGNSYLLCTKCGQSGHVVTACRKRQGNFEGGGGRKDLENQLTSVVNVLSWLTNVVASLKHGNSLYECNNADLNPTGGHLSKE